MHLLQEWRGHKLCFAAATVIGMGLKHRLWLTAAIASSAAPKRLTCLYTQHHMLLLQYNRTPSRLLQIDFQLVKSKPKCKGLLLTRLQVKGFHEAFSSILLVCLS
jgi:hypothetical protein